MWSVRADYPFGWLEHIARPVGTVGCMTASLRQVESDAGYEAWRQVRMAVHPGERCDSAEELRRGATPDQLCCSPAVMTGRALAWPARRIPLASDSSRCGCCPPSAATASGPSCCAPSPVICELGLPAVRASVADPGSLAFAVRFGFAETDRQIEQVRSVGAEPVAGRPPTGVQVVLLSDRPGCGVSVTSGSAARCWPTSPRGPRCA